MTGWLHARVLALGTQDRLRRGRILHGAVISDRRLSVGTRDIQFAPKIEPPSEPPSETSLSRRAQYVHPSVFANSRDSLLPF